MTKKDDIVQLLAEHGITIAGSLIQDTHPDGRYFVVVPVTRDGDNKQVPSNRALVAARDALAVGGQAVEFLLTDLQSQDVEAGLRATLMHSFGADIRNVFMSTSANGVHVWYEPKRVLEDSVKKLIADKARAFLRQLDLTLSSLVSTVGERLPSTLPLLRAIRQTAPARLEAVEAKLVADGFVVPSTDWLTRRMDALRRGQKVLRSEAGLYSLSLSSIRALGTRKDRNSPDISRLLALARHSR